MKEVYPNNSDEINKPRYVITIINDKYDSYNTAQFGFKEKYRIQRHANR